MLLFFFLTGDNNLQVQMDFAPPGNVRNGKWVVDEQEQAVVFIFALQYSSIIVILVAQNGF